VGLRSAGRVGRETGGFTPWAPPARRVVHPALVRTTPTRCLQRPATAGASSLSAPTSPVACIPLPAAARRSRDRPPDYPRVGGSPVPRSARANRRLGRAGAAVEERRHPRWAALPIVLPRACLVSTATGTRWVTAHVRSGRRRQRGLRRRYLGHRRGCPLRRSATRRAQPHRASKPLHDMCRGVVYHQGVAHSARRRGRRLPDDGAPAGRRHGHPHRLQRRPLVATPAEPATVQLLSPCAPAGGGNPQQALARQPCRSVRVPGRPTRKVLMTTRFAQRCSCGHLHAPVCEFRLSPLPV